VRQDIPEIGVVAEQTPDAAGTPDAPAPGKTFTSKKEKEGCSAGGSAPAWLPLLALLALARRRRAC
jgi:uncharacterized protein (TIGR03382 family)